MFTQQLKHKLWKAIQLSSQILFCSDLYVQQYLEKAEKGTGKGGLTV